MQRRGELHHCQSLTGRYPDLPLLSCQSAHDSLLRRPTQLATCTRSLRDCGDHRSDGPRQVIPRFQPGWWARVRSGRVSGGVVIALVLSLFSSFLFSFHYDIGYDLRSSPARIKSTFLDSIQRTSEPKVATSLGVQPHLCINAYVGVPPLLSFPGI